MAFRSGLLACCLLTASAAVYAERLPIRTYTNLDGLAHIRITCVFSDSHGFVWFCGPDGLSRFDGQRFTTYDVRDGLGSARINDFIQTANGDYWVATNGAGVYRYRPLRQGKLVAGGRSSSDIETPRFERFDVGDSARTARVNVLYHDRTGRLWAGTDAGLFRFDNTSFQHVELAIPGQPERGLQIWALADDRRGNLWIGTSWGLVERRPDGRHVHSTLRPTQGSDHVRALLVDSDDRLWVGHATGLVLAQPGSENQPRFRTLPLAHARSLPAALRVRQGARDPVWLTSADGLAAGMVRQILQSSDGDIWIATLEGLTQIDGEVLKTFSTANGVGKPSDLIEDAEGNLWIGTSNGAQRFSRNGFRTYAESDGLMDSPIRTVFEDTAGVVYAVSLNQRLHEFDGTRFTSVRPNLLMDRAEISNGRALRDRAGEWWVAGAAGVYRFPRVTRLEQLAHIAPLALYTERDGLAGDDVMQLFEDSRGDIWIARRYPTTLAVTRWCRSTNTFHTYGVAHGLPGFNRIVTFAEDRTGNVWAGLQGGGVARYRQGRFTVFTPAEGAPAQGVPALHVDSKGRLWLGSEKPSLSRVDDPGAERPRFVPVAQHNLYGDSVTCIGEDRFGRLYLCTLRSPIDRLDPETGEIRHFAAADGLAGADVNEMFRDHAGNMWFASSNGLLRLVPGVDRPRRPPAIRLETIRVAGERYLVSDLGERQIPNFELAAGKNRLQIGFFALGSGPGSQLRYQYRLDGLDTTWNAPTDRRDVDYGSLAPGRYRFIVRAVGPDEAFSLEPATAEFTILQPFWQRWWFQSGIAAVMTLIALTAHRLRIARLLALHQVRIRISADLHDDIGGSLSRIAIQSEVAARQAVRGGEPPIGQLSYIAESARGLVGDLSDVVWSVDPQHDDVGSVFRRLHEYADDVVTDAGARWTFTSSGDVEHVRLPPEARRHLFLLFKEALTNIARHASASCVALEIAATSRQLRVELRDDGRGFDVDQMSDPEQSGRHGLASMQRRARELNGRLAIESAADRGTRLVFEMPLRGTWRRISMLLRPRLRWRRMRSVS